MKEEFVSFPSSGAERVSLHHKLNMPNDYIMTPE